MFFALLIIIIKRSQIDANAQKKKEKKRDNCASPYWKSYEFSVFVVVVVRSHVLL